MVVLRIINTLFILLTVKQVKPSNKLQISKLSLLFQMAITTDSSVGYVSTMEIPNALVIMTYFYSESQIR